METWVLHERTGNQTHVRIFQHECTAEGSNTREGRGRGDRSRERRGGSHFGKKRVKCCSSKEEDGAAAMSGVMACEWAKTLFSIA